MNTTAALRALKPCFGVGVACIAFAPLVHGAGDGTLSEKPATSGFYMVVEKGATCDGSADDTDAIQAALDAAGQERGARVLLPNRECRVARPLRVPTATILAGSGRRSKLSAAASMDALLVFRETKAPGFFGGLEDLHIDCRKAAQYGVLVDSWRAARFEAVEINNCLAAGFHVTSDQSGDAAFLVFDQVWVRDDVSTVPVGSRFALLEAGQTGKVTDSTFRDCVIEVTTPFAGTPVYTWELRDTSRIRLEGCRISSVVPWDASVAITQTSTPPAGATARDTSSGWNIIRDFYHEQQRNKGAVGVLIDGARTKSGQFQRENVVDNINMQPTDATAVRVANSGAAGNAMGNRVFLPQRAAVAPRTVIIEKGAVQTRVWLQGGDDPVTIGPQDDRIVLDRGARTWVNGVVRVTNLDAERSKGLGANLGDFLWDDAQHRTYVVTPDGPLPIGPTPQAPTAPTR